MIWVACHRSEPVADGACSRTLSYRACAYGQFNFVRETKSGEEEAQGRTRSAGFAIAAPTILCGP